MMDDELIPARILNEWVYCPRLAWLEWRDGEWADSADTVHGRRIHRRADGDEDSAVPGPDEVPTEGEVLGRGLLLSAPEAGLIAKLDILEGAERGVRPVDYKRGSVPAEGPWPPERVQICAQALALRESGYECHEGALYFAGSRRRVTVPIDAELEIQTRGAIAALRAAIAADERPPPLETSPKCVRCSLAGICLPDEVRGVGGEEGEGGPEAARRLYPARDDAVPLHVTTPGARIAKRGEELHITLKGKLIARAALPNTASVSLYGGVSVTGPALRELMKRDIPVGWFSSGGWFSGWAHGLGGRGLGLRRAQHRAADDERAVALARRFVRAKLSNQRTLLRRNHEDAPDEALRSLKAAREALEGATDLQQIMGFEGQGAAAYFGAFGGMLRPREGVEGFEWTKRNRRPPADPVNAALSFAYALLTRVCHSTLARVGFEPMLGFLHQPRAGRPALALDVMEELRPVLADSTVLRAINNGELSAADFVQRGPACALTASGRRAVLRGWERRLDSLVTHPTFGYRLSYRRLIEVQARLLGRYLLGEIDHYPELLIR